MAKHVYRASEIPHLWAHQTQQSATDPSGRDIHDGSYIRQRLYFEGDTIYSYGEHFPIAKHVTNKQGERAVLLVNDGSWSKTTAKHVSNVASSIPNDIPTFRVPHSNREGWNNGWGRSSRPVLDNHKANLEYYLREMQACWDSINRPRSLKRLWSEKLDQMLGWQEKAIQYARFFGLRKKITYPKGCTPEEIFRLRAISDPLAEAYEASRPEWRRSYSYVTPEKMEQYKADWRLGKRSSIPKASTEPIMLRIEGQEVVTSRGARVPIEDAKRAISIARYCHTHKQAWAPKALYGAEDPTIPPAAMSKIGHYPLNNVSAEGTVTAGCHTIQYEEILRLDLLLQSAPAP